MLNVLKTAFSKKDKSINQQKKVKESMDNSSRTYFYGIGQPIWTLKNYTEFANEAYSKNVIAHRAISMIAQAAASIPLKLYQDINKEKHPIHSHPLLSLLNKPNPSQSSREFLEAIYAYRQLSGNAYIMITGLENSSLLNNCEIFNLRPDKVQVVAGNGFIPLSYRYLTGESYIDYPVDQVTGNCQILHIKNFNPLSDWYGLSSVEAASYSIDQHNQAGAWNQALLQNGARPSGAIIVKNSEGKPMNLSEEERQSLRSSIEEIFSGPANAGRPLLLEGGLEWKEMSLSPRDMDHIESKNNSAREIALALGVPPPLLGIPGDNTYSNLAEARIALWEQTIIPLVENTVDHLNRWLTPHFGEDLLLTYDTDCISALANKIDVIWRRLENSNFMTINEKRKAVGLPPLAEGDKL